MIFERVARPALFRIGQGDAEEAHHWTLARLAALQRSPAALGVLRARYAVSAPTRVFGLRFPNPVGLAAGMDKDGVALDAWPALGFGFVEVGTVTAHAQPGNDRPRLFRLRDSEAIVNRMGFNNAGAAALAARLATRSAAPHAARRSADPGVLTGDPSSTENVNRGPLLTPLGISLGKSKRTPLDEAVDDYVASYTLLRDHGDYFAVNVSSPNTPGLRALQDRDHLAALLDALVGEKPILVKIAPDLTDAAIADLLAVCLERGAAGVIATNTTLGRDGVAPSDAGRAQEAGGLSGRPLTARAREVVQFVHRETGGTLPIIGVGGITRPDDAQRMFDAGASLVQVYTGFVYHGPALVRAIASRARQASRAGSAGKAGRAGRTRARATRP